MADRGLVARFCMGAIFLVSVGFSLARAQENEPEIEESRDATEQSAEAPEPTDPPEESAEKPERTGLTEEVTVTATRVETALMKTPVAVTVFDQDTLDREGVQDIRDLANMVPNMDIATINGQSTPIISLRGVRSTNETELGDPAVGVHLDGVYSPRMQGILALMFDNERVEVLRGPQGTLFGRNSTVGNINIVTAKPQLDAGYASVSLRAGNYNFRELQAMVNIPVSKKFGLRLAGRVFGRNSYINGYWDPNQYDQRRIPGASDAEVIAPSSEECTTPPCYTRTQHSNWWSSEADGGYEIRDLVGADKDDFYMDAGEWAYRLSALWKPTNKLSLNFSWQRYRNESSGGVDLVNCEKLRGRPNYVWVPNPDPDAPEDSGTFEINPDNPVADCNDLYPEDDSYQAVVNTPGKFFLDIDYLRTQLNWDIKHDLRLVFLGGFEDMDRESAQDMELSLNAWDQAMFFLPGTGSKSWSGEVQLQSYGAKKLNWIAGVNYFHETTSTIGYFDNAIGEKSLWDQPDRSSTAGALFAQGTYSYSPKWHMTLGYRYSTEKKEDKGGRTYICTPESGCAPSYLERAELNALPADYFENPDNYRNALGDLQFFENDNEGSWNHNDFRVGLDFQKSDNTLLYAYLATGFKAGGIGDVVAWSDILPPYETHEVRTAFDQEEVTTLELGFKLRLLDRKLDLRGAYFYSDYDDMQYASVGAIAFTERWGPIYDDEGNLIGFGPVPQPVVAYYTQNVPGARIQGFELEYDSRPWQGGRIFGYASWLDTEITEDWTTVWGYDAVSYFGLEYEEALDPTNPALQVNLKGNDLAVSPPFKLHITIDHAFLLLKHNTTIVPWVTAHWEDDSYLTVWNVDKHTDDMDFVIKDEDIKYTDDKRKAWSMVHAGIRVYRGNWSAEVFGYNLTNEVVQYWGGAAESVAKGSLSVPRSYGFQVARKFAF